MATGLVRIQNPLLFMPAQWYVQDEKLISDLVIAQGTNINRRGRVFVKIDPNEDGRILIGGQTQMLIEGVVTL